MSILRTILAYHWQGWRSQWFPGRVPILIGSLLLICSPLTVMAAESTPIERAMESTSPAISRVAANLDYYRVQILFTRVHRGADNGVSFEDYAFRVDDGDYFYPASTVKLPVALLALEKLEEIEFSRDSLYRVGDDSTRHSFADDITRIFVVSDDAAYNRLFEFLGKDEINFRLRRKQLEARIAHRLSIPDSDVLPTQPVEISAGLGNGGEGSRGAGNGRMGITGAANGGLVGGAESSGEVITQTIGPIDNRPIELLPLRGLQQGVAYLENGKRIDRPFDFSRKNYLPLSSLHGIMKRLMFPQVFPESERFHLSESNREFVLRSMRTLPREAGYPEAEYPDGRLKYLVHGDRTERLPADLRIFNKIGQAYGYLTDTAYIVDGATDREYLITATVHVNANQTFNDDDYEYDEIGIPFLAELGRLLINDEGSLD